jgi:CheY-like chemotaxis protein
VQVRQALSSSRNDAAEADRVWPIIIIADDEHEVHTMTHLVVSEYTFDGCGLHFLSAYSGAETIELMHRHPDTTVILLDVVMER